MSFRNASLHCYSYDNNCRTYDRNTKFFEDLPRPSASRDISRSDPSSKFTLPPKIFFPLSNLQLQHFFIISFSFKKMYFTQQVLLINRRCSFLPIYSDRCSQNASEPFIFVIFAIIILFFNNFYFPIADLVIFTDLFRSTLSKRPEYFRLFIHIYIYMYLCNFYFYYNSTKLQFNFLLILCSKIFVGTKETKKPRINLITERGPRSGGPLQIILRLDGPRA